MADFSLADAANGEVDIVNSAERLLRHPVAGAGGADCVEVDIVNSAERLLRQLPCVGLGDLPLRECRYRQFSRKAFETSRQWQTSGRPTRVVDIVNSAERLLRPLDTSDLC